MPEPLYEDVVRYQRQRLLALEEGREEDAAVIAKFLEDEFGIVPFDVNCDDVAPSMLKTWHAKYGLPWYFDKERVAAAKPLVKQAQDSKAGSKAVDDALEGLAKLGVSNPEALTSVSKLTKATRLVTLQTTHANEPIFRQPSDHVTRGPGYTEMPLQFAEEVKPVTQTGDAWDHPAEHQRPRSKDRDLPEAVINAIRLWQPGSTE